MLLGLGFEGMRINGHLLLLNGRKLEKGGFNSLKGWYDTLISSSF